jgi:K+-transporting ATPase ATPase C chain
VRTGGHTTDADKAVGSALPGQLVDGDGLLQPRPSAAGDGYDPLNSYGSNYGPGSPDLIAAIKERKAEIAEREGVDPNISVAYAELQVARVAAAHDLSEDVVRRLADEHTSGRNWGVLGEPRVNVLELNIAVLAGS